MGTSYIQASVSGVHRTCRRLGEMASVRPAPEHDACTPCLYLQVFVVQISRKMHDKRTMVGKWLAIGIVD